MVVIENRIMHQLGITLVGKSHESVFRVMSQRQNKQVYFN